MTPHCDAFRISTKAGDVVSDPLQTEALVEESEILLIFFETYCIRKTENAQPIAILESVYDTGGGYTDLLDADDDVLSTSLHPRAWILVRHLRTTFRPPAAVEPSNYWKKLC